MGDIFCGFHTTRQSGVHECSNMATSSNKDDIRKANYASIFLSATMTAATHPIQMTKVMIQVFIPAIFMLRLPNALTLLWQLCRMCT